MEHADQASAPRLASTWQLKGNLRLPGWLKRGRQGQGPKPAAKSPRAGQWWDSASECTLPCSLTNMDERKLFQRSITLTAFSKAAEPPSGAPGKI